MAFDWSDIFDYYGIKRVTYTDKNKGAYVVNEKQRNALARAGKDPSSRPEFEVEVLFDPKVTSVDASYYESVRKGSGRPPEVRMGRGLVAWVNVGDEIVIGSKGSRVMAAKVTVMQTLAAEAGYQLARRGDRKKIVARAKQAKGKPERKSRQISDFVRDRYVVAAALLRASGICEMPACDHQLFKRGDGDVYLEVHHIVPLAEGGDDALANAAALCPSCHRELHHGVGRAAKRKKLASAVATKPLS